jgi:hypothetical protein
MDCTFALAFDFHALLRVTTAGRRQYALTFNFHHTGAAIAVRTVTLFVTQSRNVCDSCTIRRLQNRFADQSLKRLSVKFK